MGNYYNSNVNSQWDSDLLYRNRLSMQYEHLINKANLMQLKGALATFAKLLKDICNKDRAEKFIAIKKTTSFCQAISEYTSDDEYMTIKEKDAIEFLYMSWVLYGLNDLKNESNQRGKAISYISDLFCFETGYSELCKRCNYISMRYGSAISLLASVSSNQNQTVKLTIHSCINDYIESTAMDYSSYCEKCCKWTQKGVSNHELMSHPKLLQINIQRFSFP
eukprot:286290_1